MAHVSGLKSGIMKTSDADSDIFEKALNDQFEKLILQPLSTMKQPSFKYIGTSYPNRRVRRMRARRYTNRMMIG